MDTMKAARTVNKKLHDRMRVAEDRTFSLGRKLAIRYFQVQSHRQCEAQLRSVNAELLEKTFPDTPINASTKQSDSSPVGVLIKEEDGVVR